MMTFVMIVMTTLSLPECPDFNAILYYLKISTVPLTKTVGMPISFLTQDPKSATYEGIASKRINSTAMLLQRMKISKDIVKVQHLSLVSYIILFEQCRPTTLVDLLNHLKTLSLPT